MSSAHPTGRHKLKRIPDTHQIRKRPPRRPAIPSPYSSSPKVVYISSKTPFMSAVNRVRNLLRLADKRALGRLNLEAKSSDQHLLNVMAKEKERKERGEAEAVTIKGSGKVIPKVLELALFFQGQKDCDIKLKTGSVSVVDDIVERDDDQIGDEVGEEVDREKEPVPDHQVRWLSVLEVEVRLRS